MEKKLLFQTFCWLMIATWLCSFSISAQNITGKVQDENGEGLSGVSILEKGTSKGTTTKNDGTYTIVVSSSSAKLVFSFVGYLTKEMEVSNRAVINVSLVPNNNELSEIVVVGYGTQKRKI